MLKTAKRAFAQFRADAMPDYAAALTYYVMMSLFPALLIGISLLGLIGDQTLVSRAVTYARSNGAPKEVASALDASLSSTISAAGGAVSFALAIGIVVALYGASGAFGGAGRALNAIYGTEDERGFVRHKLADLGCTLIVIALGIVALFCVFLGGNLAHDLFDTIGLGSTAADIWRYVRWPVAIVAVLTIYSVVYAFAPGCDPRRVRWISAGSVVGVAIWILASAGFFFYVSNFGKYGATYGTFAGAVILLLWLYLSNIAFLFGAEIDAENARRRGQIA